MAAPNPDIWSHELEKVVREALNSIKFGTVSLVVQDGRVIQVDKSEKIRLDRQGHINGSGI